MPYSSSITIQGFKSFTSLWEDAYMQISQEPSTNIMDNDIKLFELLRNMVLSSEQPTFMRSHKLTDFGTTNNKVRTMLSAPCNQIALISWNRIPRPYTPRPSYNIQSPKQHPRQIPAPVSYLRIGNTKIIGHNKSITIQNDCVFEVSDPYTQKQNVYTIIDNNFIAKLDPSMVLYPVSVRIIDLFAGNQKFKINIKTFQDLTGIMYQKLLAQRGQMK